MQRAIQVEHITKYYGNFRAVNDLSFEVFAGEIFALLGPNGSGKTSTIRMVLDIIRPDQGSIAVLGGPMTEAKKDQIGYLPEERGLYRDLKVLDVMMFLGTLKGLTRSEARKRSLELLEQLSLSENAGQKVSELSKGMQQKVQFAVTVMHRPKLIIIDEPFTGLDPVNTQVIKRLIEQLRNEGAAIVMSTHQMHQVEAMADRMLMIHRGQQKLYGRVAEIRQRYAPHAVVVEGNGDWLRLPGVDHIDVSGNGHQRTTLYLQDQVDANEVLGAIASSPAHTITRFEQAIPTLDEIFIQVVEENQHA